MAMIRAARALSRRARAVKSVTNASPSYEPGGELSVFSCLEWIQPSIRSSTQPPTADARAGKRFFA